MQCEEWAWNVHCSTGGAALGKCVSRISLITRRQNSCPPRDWECSVSLQGVNRWWVVINDSGGGGRWPSISLSSAPAAKQWVQQEFFGVQGNIKRFCISWITSIRYPQKDNPCSFILCYSIFMNVLSIHRYWSISRWVKARPPATKVVFPAIFASRSLLGWVLSWLCTMPSSASSPTVVTSRSPGAMNYHGVTDLSTSYRTQAFHKTVISRFIAWERVGTQLNKELKYISMVKHNSNYIKWMMN